MDKRILERIKKCLALAKSSNEHEAAEALRRAQTLMREYDIDHHDVLTAHMVSEDAETRVAQTPPSFIAALANCIKSAFAVEAYLTHTENGSFIKFVGESAHVQVATYSFDVCLRQLKICRLAFMKTIHKNCKPATRTRRADLYCLGWVTAVKKNLPTFDMEPERREALTRYYNDVTAGFVDVKTRTAGKGTQRDRYAFGEGVSSGKGFNVSTPVNGKPRARISG
ncbi:MAG: DUF2786 domain-containing protein [Photobacterium halotolerans]